MHPCRVADLWLESVHQHGSSRTGHWFSLLNCFVSNIHTIQAHTYTVNKIYGLAKEIALALFSMTEQADWRVEYSTEFGHHYQHWYGRGEFLCQPKRTRQTGFRQCLFLRQRRAPHQFDHVPFPLRFLGSVFLSRPRCSRGEINSATTTRHSTKNNGVKNRKGLETEPLPAIPHFTLSQLSQDITTPGKSKRRLVYDGASALPLEHTFVPPIKLL